MTEREQLRSAYADIDAGRGTRADAVLVAWLRIASGAEWLAHGAALGAADEHRDELDALGQELRLVLGRLDRVLRRRRTRK